MAFRAWSRNRSDTCNGCGSGICTQCYRPLAQVKLTQGLLLKIVPRFCLALWASMRSLPPLWCRRTCWVNWTRKLEFHCLWTNRMPNQHREVWTLRLQVPLQSRLADVCLRRESRKGSSSTKPEMRCRKSLGTEAVPDRTIDVGPWPYVMPSALEWSSGFSEYTRYQPVSSSTVPLLDCSLLMSNFPLPSSLRGWSLLQ